MKLWASIPLILALNIANAEAAIPGLRTGEPGCLGLVLERPVTDPVAQKFPAACQALRATYLESLNLYAKNALSFEKEIAAALKTNSSPQPAYGAILMASLFSEKKLLPALEKRAQIEKSKNLKFQYARAAFERIQKGSCSSEFSEPEYREICQMRSLVAQRIVDLSRSSEAKK